jgi:tetratricopeptide (TPR) repeat protein
MGLMKRIIFSVIFCQAAALASPVERPQAVSERPEVAAARKARDRASIEDLQQIVEKTRKEATATNTFEAYLHLALFDMWLCEAIETHQNDALFKKVAEDGVAAAEKAVALNPQSSNAHWLLGDLLNQLIPHVFGGGMRYGTRATDELDRAIELDAKNAEAYVSRAISYYYTPESFGGSKSKAFELLTKAVESDDQADTPHIWLAQFHLDSGRKLQALREITLALKANPDRSFTKFVHGEIKAASKPAANSSKKKPSY